MSCNNNCNEGRNCNCGTTIGDRAALVITTLILIASVAMGYVLYKVLNGNKGQECAVQVQFKDSKATYIGTSI